MDYQKISEKEWGNFLHQSDNAYFFHSPGWAKILEKTYNYRTATRLYHINGKSILIPMMVKDTRGFKSFSSMPGSPGYGGFFSDVDISIDDIRDLVNDIIGGRNLSFNLILPPHADLPSGRSALKYKKQWKVENHNEWGNYTHFLSLENKDFEEISSNYSDSTKKQIIDAKKFGVEIKEATTLDDFRTYYDFYAADARENWGLESPPHAFEFFRNLHNYGSSHVKLSLATKDNETIAGVLSFHYTKTIYSFGGSFLEKYENFYPTKLILNNIIEQACQDDFKFINFGPSGKLKCEKFKEGFGAEKVEIKKYRVYSNLARILGKINKSW